MARWVEVAAIGDLIPEDVIAVNVDGLELAIYSVEGEVYATSNTCTHGEARLSEGFVIGTCIECPLHQGQFDIRTGEPLCAPVSEPIRCYPVRIEDGKLSVEVD